MRTEGVYIYICETCESLFGLVSRFSTKEDFIETLECPKCKSKSFLKGEGSIKYKLYLKTKTKINPVPQSYADKEDDLELLDAIEVAKYLNTSRRGAYEIMEHTGFPLIRIGRKKRVIKSEFFKWLKDYNKNKQ